MRLPLTPASVTLLTREGPYADAIEYGQTKVGDGVLDVSIVGGFVFSDTPKNGVAIVVNGEAGRRRARASRSTSPRASGTTASAS